MATTTTRLMNRKRLLDAARGLLAKPSSTTIRHEESSATRRPLKCFSLQSQHVQEAFTAATPEKFHSLLCHKIRNAKERVLLASLYVGPAASPKAAPKEQDLLDALQIAAEKPDVQVEVLLDKNRALRSVPLSGDANAETTSSAQAVSDVLEQSKPTEDSSNNHLFLFSVLPASLQYFLPNPYNEVAGVFHIKVYIIDDSLILSGANLSEEYFVDRHDRYLHITEGGAGLVDFYRDLLRVLCDHSDVYLKEKGKVPVRKPTTRTELLEALNDILTTNKDETSDQENLDNVNAASVKTVAVAVPTFQAPESFFSEAKEQRRFFMDTEVTKTLLETALKEDSSSIVRLSSAYLNPTDSFLRVLANFEAIEFLTAGRISHGFAPQKKAGNKGKDWIPSVFETLSQEACRHLEAAKLLYYERPGWTFHAKGLWLESNSSLAAAICGSGNYGARSETLDMESNCVLILPPASPLQQPLQKEWTDMMEYTQPLEMVASGSEKADQSSNSTANNKPASLSWSLQVCLPLIRKFM